MQLRNPISRVSIPNGSIKRDSLPCIPSSRDAFQFQMVQLKDDAISDMFTNDYGFNSKWFN